MSIISEISRIETAASTIKTKAAALGLKTSSGVTVTSSSKIDACADAISTISKQTAVTQTLNSTTTSVNLRAGYYNASSTISVTTMGAPTVSLSGSSQTISCKNKLMTGNITIPAANVLRVGSETPSNSLGNNGDIYLVV